MLTDESQGLLLQTQVPLMRRIAQDPVLMTMCSSGTLTHQLALPIAGQFTVCLSQCDNVAPLTRV